MGRFTTGLVSLILLAGCGREPPCPTAVDHFHPFGSRYVVEIESARPAEIASQVVSRAEGDKPAPEVIEWKWGGNVLLLSKDGQLTFNGTEYGDIEPGDRVRVDKDGRVSVNGEPRR